jgi:hypothetical protein
LRLILIHGILFDRMTPEKTVPKWAISEARRKAGAIHLNRVSAYPDDPEQDQRLVAPAAEALRLRRPLPDVALPIAAPGEVPDCGELVTPSFGSVCAGNSLSGAAAIYGVVPSSVQHTTIEKGTGRSAAIRATAMRIRGLPNELKLKTLCMIPPLEGPEMSALTTFFTELEAGVSLYTSTIRLARALGYGPAEADAFGRLCERVTTPVGV